MFKFGHKYIEPNKNGRIYSNISYEEFTRVFHEVADRIAEQGRHNVANFIVVSARYFDVIDQNTDDFKFGR